MKFSSPSEDKSIRLGDESILKYAISQDHLKRTVTKKRNKGLEKPYFFYETLVVVKNSQHQNLITLFGLRMKYFNQARNKLIR